MRSLLEPRPSDIRLPHFPPLRNRAEGNQSAFEVGSKSHSPFSVFAKTSTEQRHYPAALPSVSVTVD